MKKNILVLGGYGSAGKQIAELLLRQSPELHIILAGRNMEKAVKESERINETLDTRNVSAEMLDVSDHSALIKAFNNVDFIVNASSTMEHTPIIVEALLQSSSDYLDIQLSSPIKLEVLTQYARQFKEEDICVVTDGGFHPGLPAALVRYAALRMDKIKRAHLYGALKINWAETPASKSTMIEFIEEFKHYSNLMYEGGQWQKQPYSKTYPFDFGEPFGETKCAPMFLEEFKVLSKQLPHLKETGFFISGFNPFLDNWLLPIIFLGVRVVPRKWCEPFFHLFKWGSKFTKPPYGVKLVCECTGIKNTQPVTVRLEITEADEYLLTAAPAAACVLQLIDGNVRVPGLWHQSNVVEPIRFLADMDKMGVESLVFRNEEKIEMSIPV